VIHLREDFWKCNRCNQFVCSSTNSNHFFVCLFLFRFDFSMDVFFQNPCRRRLCSFFQFFFLDCFFFSFGLSLCQFCLSFPVLLYRSRQTGPSTVKECLFRYWFLCHFKPHLESMLQRSDISFYSFV